MILTCATVIAMLALIALCGQDQRLHPGRDDLSPRVSWIAFVMVICLSAIYFTIGGAA